MSSDDSARERNRRSRQRRKEGLRSWDLDLPDVATEEMITALVHYGRLTEDEAENEDRVAVEIAVIARRLLLWWAEHWRELDVGDLEISAIRVSHEPPEDER